MGHGYIVEEAVEKYLSELCERQDGPVTGLIVGQTFQGTPQKDFVIMAIRTPPREEFEGVAGNALEKEWVSEHARQVSRMLPGGLSVLGVFIITDNNVKDTITTLRQLVFAAENLISSEYIWERTDGDSTVCVTLHINPKTRKTTCKTYDIEDPKNTGKPAEWKYQSGVCSSWILLSCCLNVDVLVPLPENKTDLESMDKCLKDGLKVWANNVENAVCLIDGNRLPEDEEFTVGQKKNGRHVYTGQLLVSSGEQITTDLVHKCGGSLFVRGTIHSRAYLHNNKPKAGLAEKMLKRDVLSTVAIRVQMMLEELLVSEEEKQGKQTEGLCVPRRIFCPLSGCGPLTVCDYQYSDEGKSETCDRLKEMLDISASEDDLDTTQEIQAGPIENVDEAEPVVETVKTTQTEPKKNNCAWFAFAIAVALLAIVVSLLYLSHSDV